jgi:NDP-sugar pyrophosphorylase family protein
VRPRASVMNEDQRTQERGRAAEPQAHRPTQAVVLAGGQGSRLRPYTDDRPKPMVEIPSTGTPIIGHQLAWLAAEGVTHAVVSCGHLAEVMQEWLDQAELPLRVTVVVENEPLGRGGGLKYAAAFLPHPDQAWYATNGDVWTRFSLSEMADFHAERDATATLALARPRIPWGVVETDEFGHVLDFIEAPPSPYPINAGVYVFSAAFAEMLPERGDHERTTFPRLARERALAGFPLPLGAYWRAIDTAKDLTEAARDLTREA